MAQTDLAHAVANEVTKRCAKMRPRVEMESCKREAFAPADELIAEVETAGGSAVFIDTDVSDEAACNNNAYFSNKTVS